MRTGYDVGPDIASSLSPLPMSGVPRQVTVLTSWTVSDKLSGQTNASQSWPTWQARLPYNEGKGRGERSGETDGWHGHGVQAPTGILTIDKNRPSLRMASAKCSYSTGLVT